MKTEIEAILGFTIDTSHADDCMCAHCGTIKKLLALFKTERKKK